MTNVQAGRSIDPDIIEIIDDDLPPKFSAHKLLEIFPDADPEFIQQLYSESHINGLSESQTIDVVIEKILEAGEYPKIEKVKHTNEEIPEDEVDKEEELAFLQELLPDADSIFLRKQVEELNSEELRKFVLESLDRRDYPTSKECERKRHISAQMKQYTTEFSVEKFVSLDLSLEAFQNVDREININRVDISFVKLFFKDLFPHLYWREIMNTVERNKGKIFKTLLELRKSVNFLKSKRVKTKKSCVAVCQNIPLLQQLAFIEHEDKIVAYLKKEKEQKEIELFAAKKAGLTVTCSCCFDEDVMPHDFYSCLNSCQFCRNCIIKSVEVAFGDGKVNFPCLGGCESFFPLNHLQNFLPPNLFSKIAQKQAVAEIKSAELENLEFCPFCDFATVINIPPETGKVFACQNPECFKESCRLCKKDSHVPLRCDEVEEDEEVERRVYIQNKMTEALLRKCWKCGINFYKEEGCNKMTCSCGALMCYVCQQPIENYKHFDTTGGKLPNLCPLNSDTLNMNRINVKQAGNQAKQELGLSENTFMKVDSTANIDNYFKTKVIPVRPPFVGGVMEHMNQRQRTQLMARGHMRRHIAINKIPAKRNRQ